MEVFAASNSAFIICSSSKKVGGLIHLRVEASMLIVSAFLGPGSKRIEFSPFSLLFLIWCLQPGFGPPPDWIAAGSHSVEESSSVFRVSNVKHCCSALSCVRSVVTSRSKLNSAVRVSRVPAPVG